MKPHLSITEAMVAAAVSSVLSLVVGFGIMDAHTAGIIVGLVGPVFGFVVLIANSIHALAAGHAAQAVALLSTPSVAGPTGPQLVQPLADPTPPVAS